MGYLAHNPHHCEIITTHAGHPYHHPMAPNLLFYSLYIGSAVVFTILVIGLLLVIDRARLTPIVRAREYINDITNIENTLMRAIVHFTQLNTH